MSQPLREKDIERLLRGISTNHVETVRGAWRRLLAEPEIAVPLVLAKLDTNVWRHKPVGPSYRYLGVLLTLLHELDVETFWSEVTRLQSARLHALHKHTVNLVSKRYGDRVFGEVAGGVPVYIADDIAQRDLVFSHLQRWSKTPDLAISTVTREDVIALRDEMDYLGRYRLLYDSIVLAWPEAASNPLERWLQILWAELTFYHEVGHHYYQHIEGGQVDAQEREAKNYARVMYWKAHPIFVPLVRFVFSPIILVRKAWRLAAKWRRNSEF
ncbi:hypothetical protein shim_15840 [Shimia sp. SK013]|uniref:hypothetical protein n=1 Tax=Shimia sp. SK013 TaxID=1389006 RepID=UPI0006B448A6|nr:hypothetical protein [Shimia sp. SK013]KPA22137.1 hypothetical protein shim_15840 [Shimia sp. SK013]